MRNQRKWYNSPKYMPLFKKRFWNCKKIQILYTGHCSGDKNWNIRNNINTQMLQKNNKISIRTPKGNKTYKYLEILEEMHSCIKKGKYLLNFLTTWHKHSICSFMTTSFFLDQLFFCDARHLRIGAKVNHHLVYHLVYELKYMRPKWRFSSDNTKV